MTVTSKLNMSKLSENTLRNYPRPFITVGELETLIDGTADSRYSRVKRLVAQGKLLHIRRGLYRLTEEVGFKT